MKYVARLDTMKTMLPIIQKPWKSITMLTATIIGGRKKIAHTSTSSNIPKGMTNGIHKE